jgi:long-chain acyl-CoA synthetase
MELFTRTPLDAFLHWEKNTPDRPFLLQPINGDWKTWTFKQAGVEMRKIATSLIKQNLLPRSNVAILSKNCAHWILADIAIWMAGHVSVPIYPTLSAQAINRILVHSEAKIIFIGKLDDFKIQLPGISEKVTCISITMFGEKKGLQWDDLLQFYEPLRIVPSRHPAELATIKYTSGTTGNPKGVMISFEALNHAITRALKQFALPSQGQRFFSYLPLSHVAERMMIEMGAIYSSAPIYFAESIEKFADNLRTAQPTIFVAVPRIWTKFREQIESKIPRLTTLLKIPLLNIILKKMIKRKLGLSKTIWAFTGAAPISVELLEWFAQLDIVIHEVYGMTESLSYSHINLHQVKFGTVGKAWDDVLVRLSDQQEIQVKHKALLIGYYREPHMTCNIFTDDGFLKTGDKGEVDADGFLTITGRVNDQFKTDKGKFVDPAPIELMLLANTDIEQVCVVGSGVPQPLALIVLSVTGKVKRKEVVAASILKTIQATNARIESYEQIEAAVILKTEWTVENGLLTPTMKVKRNEVENIYRPNYLIWYNEQNVCWG